MIDVSMNFGSGAAHIIYRRGWDEVWRRFVRIVESGLANIATSIAEDLVATRRVCHFQVTSYQFEFECFLMC
jgi:hypothetical protein